MGLAGGLLNGHLVVMEKPQLLHDSPGDDLRSGELALHRAALSRRPYSLPPTKPKPSDLVSQPKPADKAQQSPSPPEPLDY